MRSRALFVKPQGSILVIGIMTMANGWIVGPGQRKLSTWNEAFRVSQPTFRYWRYMLCWLLAGPKHQSFSCSKSSTDTK
ncbi:putative phosphatidate cytidylyltransferase [Fusarium oxysporum f. sp. albedinis]|nr:putative phosphatidate cytidylyltransferase [Fusarium oxysporum f. sp. albedinis]